MFNTRAKRMAFQKVAGIIFLLISAFIIYLAKTALVVGDNDISFTIITIPMGLFLLFTREDCVA